jgi:hypothetical protein
MEGNAAGKHRKRGDQVRHAEDVDPHGFARSLLPAPHPSS